MRELSLNGNIKGVWISVTMRVALSAANRNGFCIVIQPAVVDDFKTESPAPSKLSCNHHS